MPIHDVGYRSWDGERTSQLSRWTVISETGIRLAAKSRWVRRILFVAWLPVMYWGFGFFFLEKSIEAESDSLFSVESFKIDDGTDQPLTGLLEDQENIKARIEAIQKLLDDRKASDEPEETESEPEPDQNQEVEVATDSGSAQAKTPSRRNRRRRQRDEGFVPPMDGLLKNFNEIQEKLKVAREYLTYVKDITPDNTAEIEEAKELVQQLTGQLTQATAANEVREALVDRFAIFPHAQDLVAALESGDKERIRNDIWRWLLMIFFRYPQSLLILLLIGTVAPALISRDLRSRAFLLYFSRPIGKLEYIFGKLCIPAAFIVAVTTLPAIALYFFAIAMSPSLSVIWSTWDIPFRIIAASFALVIPTASIALMLSSLTQESRYANFSWFAVWALGHGAWLSIVLATAMRMGRAPFDRMVLDSSQVKNWSVLSLYNCLGDVQEFIFGFEPFSNVWRGTAALGCITIFSLFMLYRQVSAPVRV